MKKRVMGLVSLLLAAVLALAGCGEKAATYAESGISFLDNLRFNADRYVLMWMERPTEYKRLTNAVNVLAPAWLYVQTDEESGETALRDSVELGDTVDYASYVKLAAKDSIAVWVSAVCPAESAGKVLEKEAVRKQYLEKLVSFAEASGVSGINLYFPGMAVDLRSSLTSLVTEVRASLPEGTMLNVCVEFSAGGSTTGAQEEGAYDYTALADTSDHLLLMAFEQYGTAGETAGPICGYDWLSGNVMKLLNMVPSDKLMLILAFYGRDFRFAKDGTPLWTEDATKCPVVDYGQMEELYEQKQYFDTNEELTTSTDTTIAESYDKTYRAAYVKFTDTNDVIHVIWYDNTQSMQDKSALAVQYGMAGVGAYHEGYSDMNLWKGIRTSLDQENLSEHMVEDLALYMNEVSVYNPDTDLWTFADARGVSRVLNLLSVCGAADSSGVDTGYALRAKVQMEDAKRGQELRWVVREKNGRYLLVPDNEYTSIVTSGLSLWMPMGFTPQMLEGVCIVQQEAAE